MKKSALALAVAAALVGFGTAAHADTTLYGSARVSLDYDDNDTTYAPGPVPGTIVPVTGKLGNQAWDIFNNSSRLGVRGEEDLGGGLSAIYQYEFGVDMTEGGNLNSNRPKWVGLKGGFGSVTAGTQWTPYYNVIGIGDIFNSDKVFDSDVFLGNAYAKRMDNSVIYSTPNFSGFSAQAMLVFNGSCTPTDPTTPAQLCKTSDTNKLPGNLSNDLDMWNIGVSYKNGPFFAGGTYIALEGSNFSNFPPTEPASDGEQWGLAFGYNSGPIAVTLAYENGDINDLYYGKSENIYLTGQYTFGPNIIRASYGHVSPEDDRGAVYDAKNVLTGEVAPQDDINNWALGYQYNFSKRTRIWVEWMDKDVDNSLVGDKQTVSIGTRHDF